MSRTVGAKDVKPRKRRASKYKQTYKADYDLLGANQSVVKAYQPTPRWYHFIKPVVWFFLGFGFCYFFF